MRRLGRLLIAVGIVLFSVSVGGLAYNAYTSVVNTVPNNGIYYALMYLGIGFIIVGSYLVVFSPDVGEDGTAIFKPSTGKQDAGLAPSNTIKTAGSFWSIELYTLRVKDEA
jgi:hypothetical protein